MKIVKLYKYAKFGDSVHKKYLNQGYSNEVINSYLREFSEIRKQKPKELFHEIPNVNVSTEDRNNIDKYHNFNDLENVVDYVKGQRTKIQYGKDIENEEHPNTLLKDNGLSIIRADNANQAVQAKGSGNQTWCVARSDSGNLFNSYRYRQHEPTFYFVKDNEMDAINPNHHIVIQVTKNGQYIVTNSNNDGDKELNWEELLEIQPKLEGKQNLFKHVPVPADVKTRYHTYEYTSDRDFIALPKEHKLEYLEMHGFNKGLSDIKFQYLSDDLKNLYISYGLGLSWNQYKEIESNNQLKNRLEEIATRKLEAHLNGDIVRFSAGEIANTNNEEIQKIAIKSNVSAIKFIENASEELKQMAVQEYGSAIHYIDNPSEEVQKIAVKNRPQVIKYIKNPTEEVQRATVSRHGPTIQLILEKGINPSEEVQRLAVKQNSESLKLLIMGGITPSEETQKIAVAQNAILIFYIDHPSEEVQFIVAQNKPTVILQLDHPHPNVIKYLEELKNEKVSASSGSSKNRIWSSAFNDNWIGNIKK